MEFKTKILLRNDTAENWTTNNPVLGKGEVGIESDTSKMKLGDGAKHWKELAYFKGDIDLTDLEASNVYFANNITLAGDYKEVGNVKLAEGELVAKGKTVEELFTEIFTKELQPKEPTQPSIDLKINNSNNYSVEAGTSVALKWTTTTNPGAYTYKSSVSNSEIKPVDGTGVSFTGFSLTKTGAADPIAVTQEGTGDSFVVEDSPIVFTMTANHSAGNYALSNLNKLASPEKKIAAGSKADSVTISSYRKEFAGGTTTMTTVDSALIRGLDKNRATAADEFEFLANKGDTKLIFACPKGVHATVKFQYFTMSWESFAGFEKLPAAVKVADVRGGAEGLKDYDVWEYIPAGPFAAPTKYKVIFE